MSAESYEEFRWRMDRMVTADRAERGRLRRRRPDRFALFYVADYDTWVEDLVTDVDPLAVSEGRITALRAIAARRDLASRWAAVVITRAVAAADRALLWTRLLRHIPPPAPTTADATLLTSAPNAPNPEPAPILAGTAAA